MIKQRLFHLSTSEAPITRFHPLALFSSHATAVALAGRASMKGLPRTLYEVEVEGPDDFLMTPDLSAAVCAGVHLAGTIAQVLGAQPAIERCLPRAKLTGVVARSIDYGPKSAADDLVNLLKSSGYRALVYPSHHVSSDSGAFNDDVSNHVLLDSPDIRGAHVSRWSDSAAAGGQSDIAVSSEWQPTLNAIINTRLFLVGQTVTSRDTRHMVRTREITSGLEQSQTDLMAGRYVSASLHRDRMEDALALLHGLFADASTSTGRRARDVAHDLTTALADLAGGAAAVQCAQPVKLRTPFVPVDLSQHRFAA